MISIFASIFLYFSFSLLYNGLCDDCLGLPSNYWVMQMMIVSPVFWLVILLTIVLALLPRYEWINLTESNRSYSVLLIILSFFFVQVFIQLLLKMAVTTGRC